MGNISKRILGFAKSLNPGYACHRARRRDTHRRSRHGHEKIGTTLSA